MSSQKKIRKILEGSVPVVLVSHRKPDGDAIGTMLGLALWRREHGGRAEILCPGGVQEPYTFLEGTGTVMHDVPHDLDDFNLVVVDTPDLSRVSGVGNLGERALTVVNIDHHPDNTAFGDVSLVDPSASSAALLAAEVLIGEGPDDLSAGVATALYTGILTDTGAFRFGNTDARTLDMAARMVALGASPAAVATAVYGEQPLGAFRLLGMVLSTTETALDGRVAVSVLTRRMKDESGSDGADLEGLASYGRLVRGVEVALLLREEDAGIRISLRSRGTVDVNAIAARLGGGGHKAAAGVVIDASIDEARRRLIEAVSKSLSEA